MLCNSISAPFWKKGTSYFFFFGTTWQHLPSQDTFITSSPASEALCPIHLPQKRHSESSRVVKSIAPARLPPHLECLRYYCHTLQWHYMHSIYLVSLKRLCGSLRWWFSKLGWEMCDQPEGPRVLDSRPVLRRWLDPRQTCATMCQICATMSKKGDGL